MVPGSIGGLVPRACMRPKIKIVRGITKPNTVGANIINQQQTQPPKN